MSFKNLGGGMSLQGIVNDMNQNINELKNQEITKIIKDETGARRVLLGKGASDFYGLKVSQPGFDVYSASDDELVFNSDNNVFKIVDSGTVTMPEIGFVTANNNVAVEEGNVTYEHNLGYTPSVIAYEEYDGGFRTSMPYYRMDHRSSFNNWDSSQAEYYVDDTVITFIKTVTISSTSSVSVLHLESEIKFYLLRETAD